MQNLIGFLNCVDSFQSYGNFATFGRSCPIGRICLVAEFHRGVSSTNGATLSSFYIKYQHKKRLSAEAGSLQPVYLVV